jgi:hypothetical protein
MSKPIFGPFGPATESVPVITVPEFVPFQPWLLRPLFRHGLSFQGLVLKIRRLVKRPVIGQKKRQKALEHVAKKQILVWIQTSP